MFSYPDALIEYLVYFHADRDYFECHEVMEEYWKEEPDSPHNRIWLGLIQTAVSLYHHRRENIAGARKMALAAVRNLGGQRLHEVGIDGPELSARLTAYVKRLHESEKPAFRELEIPLSDEALLKKCLDLCTERGVVWLGVPPDPDSYVVHKHTLRDRSDVIRERNAQLERRRGNAR